MPAGEIALLEGLTVVYKSSIDLYFYVIGSSHENEVGGDTEDGGTRGCWDGGGVMGLGTLGWHIGGIWGARAGWGQRGGNGMWGGGTEVGGGWVPGEGLTVRGAAFGAIRAVGQREGGSLGQRGCGTRMWRGSHRGAGRWGGLLGGGVPSVCPHPSSPPCATAVPTADAHSRPQLPLRLTQPNAAV